MLAGHLRSGGSEWQHGGLLLGKPTPLQPPSEACVARKGAAMPSSNLLVDYSAELGAFKVEQERGRVRVVSTFQQGFGGVGAERYPTGESYIGTYADAKRAGKGTFIDSDGATMLSVFKAGRAVGEGAKRTAGGDLMRTHDGKVRHHLLLTLTSWRVSFRPACEPSDPTGHGRSFGAQVDGVISLSDATSIAKNSGLGTRACPLRHTASLTAPHTAASHALNAHQPPGHSTSIAPPSSLAFFKRRRTPCRRRAMWRSAAYIDPLPTAPTPSRTQQHRQLHGRSRLRPPRRSARRFQSRRPRPRLTTRRRQRPRTRARQMPASHRAVTSWNASSRLSARTSTRRMRAWRSSLASREIALRPPRRLSIKVAQNMCRKSPVERLYMRLHRRLSSGRHPPLGTWLLGTMLGTCALHSPHDSPSQPAPPPPSTASAGAPVSARGSSTTAGPSLLFLGWCLRVCFKTATL